MSPGARRGRAKPRPPSVWRGRLLKLLHLVAEQALPLTIAGVSFVIALDAWLSARPVLWEQQRALATVSIATELEPAADGRVDSRHTITITNVGELTFAVLDIQIGMAVEEGAQAPWRDNTLLRQSPVVLPIGLRPFHLEPARDGRSAMFAFDQTSSGWHAVDPGRSVELVFVQPVTGPGRLDLGVEVFAQPLRMAALADQITVERVIAGHRRQVFPETGEGEVSDLGVFPYSASSIVVVPAEPVHVARTPPNTPLRPRRRNEATNP